VNQLEELLQRCTVRLSLPDSCGTGFFVAPGLILTCAHVVRQAEDRQVEVFWQPDRRSLSARVQQIIDNNESLDCALLALAQPLEHPCVLLDEASVEIGQELYAYGYLKSYNNAAPVRLLSEGWTGDTPPLIKLQAGQIESGLSGAALVNLSTRTVCGMIKETRASGFDLGGGAVPTYVILEQFPELRQRQRQWHQSDQQWVALLHPTQKTVKKILLLSAAPENSEPSDRSRRLAEVKKIKTVLKNAERNQSAQSEKIELRDETDIEIPDLLKEMLEIEPDLIDISGKQNGIKPLLLRNHHNKTEFYNSEKLISEFFEIYAKIIIQHTEYVVGISQELDDTKILTFLDHFYYSLGLGKSLKRSYQAGCFALRREDIDDDSLPKLIDSQEEKRRKELEEELELCDKEIEKDQKNIKLWKRKADILKDLNRSVEMNEAYEKASLLAPKSYQLRTIQGDNLEQLGQHREAIAAYNKAIELEEKDYKIWWKKGQALVEVRQYSEAVESYKNAVLLDPPSPDSYVICREYGFVLAEMKQHQKSIGLYKKSLGFEPRYRVSNYEKRRVYKEMCSRNK
jgi:tetratricopeptide (TPR) repeat protein